MVASNIQAFFHPTWLASLWYVPWLLTGALLVAWVACRALDKATTETGAPPQPSSSRGKRDINTEDAA
ncbi:hypothetical protein ABZX62_05990 [Streptomyces flavidovirens]|uniref:Integral membrane protein n=1 Tax=Streptomyces flavidovirens TaxID=67298 RepID=A0ABW6RF58_9ACTN